MDNNKQNIYDTIDTFFNAKSQLFETQYISLDKFNNSKMDNNSIISNKSLPLPLEEKKKTKNQINIQNISQYSNINQINSKQKEENISKGMNLNPSINQNINQTNSNINKSNNNIIQQSINPSTENMNNNNNTNNQIPANNNSQIIIKEYNIIENQKNNNQNNNTQIANKNINNNKSNKPPIKEPLDSIRKKNPIPQTKNEPPSKQKFSFRKFILNPNSTLMGKTIPKAMPVYNFINKGIGLCETEEQGIVFCAMTIYQEEMMPLSNNTAKYIQSKLGGDWLVIVYPEGKPIDFNLTMISRNDFMYFTIDKTAFQICRLR